VAERNLQTCRERGHHLDRRADQLAEQYANSNADELLTTAAVADWLRVSRQFLEIGRVQRYGPPFIRVGPRVILYRRGDVIAWLRERTYRSTRLANTTSLGRQGKRVGQSASSARRPRAAARQAGAALFSARTHEIPHALEGSARASRHSPHDVPSLLWSLTDPRFGKVAFPIFEIQGFVDAAPYDHALEAAHGEGAPTTKDDA